jgi:1,4-alpha-glucan branching enzyme
MKRIFFVLTFSLIGLCSFGQKVALDPTITPSLFRHDTQITVVYDVTGTSLATLSAAYIWVWVPGKNIDAKYNVNPASSDVTKTNNARFTKTISEGRTLFTITFKPSDFFASDISNETTIGMLLKGNDWPNGQTTDYLAGIWDGSFQVKLNSPEQRPLFVATNDEINIVAETPVAANFDLYINDVLADEQDGVSVYTYAHTVAETTGGATVKIVATQGANASEISFQYIVSAPSPVAVRPVGIIPGINYQDDKTKATLCLWAPGKSSAYVLGDFTDWDVLPEYIMKKDGEYFWLEIGNLTEMQEYAFQYLVDESIFIADPYSDMILDPDDQYIPESVYPNLKPFPEKALKDEWYFNRLSVLQTGQPAFTAEAFTKPPKEELVVYELLIRDFFGNGDRSFQNLIDTLSYLKRLGVNAVELMPIMEFNGNESWGYNPTFMFAPDKYYGPKEKLREFVSAAHQEGIAVILDIALNHQDIPNSYLMLDFNFSTFTPEADNKWFNITATHPFSVFFDMNHESAYTKKYIDTINYHWINHYNVDGFRFDLSKGFTQTNNPNNVEAWSNYDASRIAILKRMADKIWSYKPDAYVILEHLSVNSEEKELAEYRAAEGKGMMLWGKMTDQYNEATMGHGGNSNISPVYHGTRGWSKPRLIGYMESHDEERLMNKNLLYGNESGSYHVKDTATALLRQAAAAVAFYTVPGPKMLWQFGELGYGYSINHCPDGTVNNDCRISPKPVRWDYKDDEARDFLFRVTSDVIRLKTTYDVFSSGSAVITNDSELVKQILLKNDPYTATPASSDEMNAVVVSNFDVSSRNVSVTFPHGGTWYRYFQGDEVEVTGTSLSTSMAPGEYEIFTDFAIEASVITNTEGAISSSQKVSLFPNPATSTFTIAADGLTISNIFVLNSQGISIALPRLSAAEWDASSLAAGMYILKVQTNKGRINKKLVKF